MQYHVYTEPAHSGQVCSAGHAEEDEEQPTAEGSFGADAFMDSLAEGVDVSDLHLSCKLSEGKAELTAFPFKTVERIARPAVLRAGEKCKPTLLSFLVEPVDTFFWHSEVNALASWLLPVDVASLSDALYRHGQEIKTDDIPCFELCETWLTVSCVEMRETVWQSFRWGIGLDIEILVGDAEEDALLTCRLSKEFPHHHLMDCLPVRAREELAADRTVDVNLVFTEIQVAHLLLE